MTSARPILPTRPLGRSGLQVSEIGFGAASISRPVPLPGPHEVSAPDPFYHIAETQAVDTVTAALRAGITLVDTSPFYGHGLSELRVGSGLRRVPEQEVVLSTKVGRVTRPFARRGDGSANHKDGHTHGLVFDYSYDGTMRSLEQSALRLGVDRIDVVLIHDVDVWTQGPYAIEDRFREAMGGAYRALDRLRSAGAVKAIGVGLNEADMCERFARVGDFDVMLLAGRYTLLEQTAFPSFMTLAHEKRIGVMLGGVYNSGILATGPVPGARYNYQPAPPKILARAAAIEAACRRHDVPLRRAALHFALAHPAVATLVLGAVRPKEIEDPIGELGATVPPALWSELKAESLLAEDVPTPS